MRVGCRGDDDAREYKEDARGDDGGWHGDAWKRRGFVTRSGRRHGAPSVHRDFCYA